MKNRLTLSAATLLLVAAAALPGTGAAATRPLTSDSFAAIRTAHRTEPLIVHVWGMTCGPCVAELPKWGAFIKHHPTVHLVLIQADESSPADAARRLRTAGLGQVESWSVTSDPDEFLRASIDPQWAGDMPRTLLISANGNMTRLRGTADFDEVSRWLAHNPEQSR